MEIPHSPRVSWMLVKNLLEITTLLDLGSGAAIEYLELHFHEVKSNAMSEFLEMKRIRKNVNVTKLSPNFRDTNYPNNRLLL